MQIKFIFAFIGNSLFNPLGFLHEKFLSLNIRFDFKKIVSKICCVLA